MAVDSYLSLAIVLYPDSSIIKLEVAWVYTMLEARGFCALRLQSLEIKGDINFESVYYWYWDSRTTVGD